MCAIHNSIGGEVKPLTKDAFYAMLDLDLHTTVAEMLCAEGATGMVVFENLDLCSSNLGRRTFVVYGPCRSNATLEDLAKQRLGDVLGRFQYPIAYYQRVIEK